MESTITQILVSLFNIPEWAPRAIRRAAVVTLATAAILTPTYFNDAVGVWTRQYTHVLMQRMQPILDSLAQSPTPAQPTKTPHRHRPAHHPTAAQPPK